LVSHIREEHRLRLFENTVVRRIFEPKRNEITGGWRKLLSEELQNLYKNQVKEDEMSRPYNTNGEKRNAYRIFVGKPEGKGPLGRLRCSWEDAIKIDLREIVWVTCTGLI
jgi:hypothetical protein